MKVRFVWLSVLFLVLLLSGCGTEEAGEDFPAYLVAVAGQGTYGSGIIYRMDGENMDILTAAHVVEGEQALKDGASDAAPFKNGGGAQAGVRFCDGWEILCTDIMVSGTADLAMIRIPVSGISEKRLQRYQCVKTDKGSFDARKAGDSCTALGVGVGETFVRYEGCILEPWIYMEDYGQYMIWAQAEIQPGMSGGGLFDREGYFIGILSGGNEEGELAAVPLSLILQFDMDIGN